MKNAMTQAGIEPATFRLVAQHLNHRDTRHLLSKITAPSFRLGVGVCGLFHASLKKSTWLSGCVLPNLM